jgi:hypothetical protein
MKRHLSSVLPLGALLVALGLGCSGTDYDTPACLGALVTMATTACTSCEQGPCGSELDSVESGCQTYLQCICPGGMVSASGSEACEDDISAPSCASAVQAMQACISAHCAGQC